MKGQAVPSGWQGVLLSLLQVNFHLQFLSAAHTQQQDPPCPAQTVALVLFIGRTRFIRLDGYN